MKNHAFHLRKQTTTSLHVNGRRQGRPALNNGAGRRNQGACHPAQSHPTRVLTLSEMETESPRRCDGQATPGDALALIRWMRFLGGTDISAIGSGACLTLAGALPLPCDMSWAVNP